MSRWVMWVLFSTLGLAGCSAQKAAVGAGDRVYGRGEIDAFVSDTDTQPVGSDYVIGIGDELEVVFVFHEDLTTSGLVVRSDGKITLPYVGDVTAAGLKPMELDSVLTGSFQEILKEPNISVIVRGTPVRQVYVLGEVDRPGQYPFRLKMSMLQALAVAGGFERGAKSSHVLVIRREGLSRIVGVEVDAKSMLRGIGLKNDFALRDNDIVYVPKTRVASLAEFTDVLNSIINPPTSLILRGWQVQVLQSQLELLRD